MATHNPSLAVIGAGIGGLALAAALRRNGTQVRIYEQAPQFQRLGAGIQMSPNAMRVLRVLGLEPKLRGIAFQPESWRNRQWDSGEMKFELPLGGVIEARYGAPYLLLHRGDLHAALAALVPPQSIHLGKRLTEIDRTARGIELRFADGSRAEADGVIGADGVHSRIREILLGPEAPRYTGRVAYRTVFPAALLDGQTIDHCTKWWGPDRHIVIYYVTPRRDEVYFVTSVPEPDWKLESWSARGDVHELRQAFVGFHEQVQRVLNACPQVHKWALVERDPLPRWSEDGIVLLGDACHPMTPYMAQGAATALEDAAVLSRCLDGVGRESIAEAFHRFEAVRKDRTSRIQEVSHLNTWMRQRTDPDWVYGYDPWSTPMS